MITDTAAQVKPNNRTPVFVRVLQDLISRVNAGTIKYGTPLQPFNGRSALKDAYEEAQDLTMYLGQALLEAEAASDKPDEKLIRIELPHMWDRSTGLANANGRKSVICVNKSALCVLGLAILNKNSNQYRTGVMPVGSFSHEAVLGIIEAECKRHLGMSNYEIVKSIDDE